MVCPYCGGRLKWSNTDMATDLCEEYRDTDYAKYWNGNHDKVESGNSRDMNPHTKRMASTLYNVHDCTEKEIRTKQCERWQALSILRRHEAWRHGYDGKTHPSAKELTWAMQYIIRELKKHFKEHIYIYK